MSIVGYGYGLNDFVSGGASAFGFGINPLSQVINETISFTTNTDLDLLNSATSTQDISFNIDLLLSIVNQLDANPNINIDVQTAINTVTQIDYNPEVIFNTALGEEFINNIISSLSAEMRAEFELDPAGFLLKLFLDPQNLYVVPEDLRFLKIFQEQRTSEVKEETREMSVEYEDRITTIPENEDEDII